MSDPLMESPKAAIQAVLERVHHSPTEGRDYFEYAADEVAQLVAPLSEMQATFDLRWKADMRAIEMWHAAGGDELTWPDHADLVVWLLERDAALRTSLAMATRHVSFPAADSWCTACDRLHTDADEEALAEARDL